MEDNPIAQTVNKTIITQFDCQVDLASTGKEAIDLWKKNKYDLIFMDIGLPDMDGYQITHYIRVQEVVRNNHTPIIALTAHAGEENKQRCIESGMNAVISKPLSKKSCSDFLNSFIFSKPKENDNISNHYCTDLPETDEQLFNLYVFPILEIEEGIKTMGSEDILCEMLNFMIRESLPEDIAILKQAHDTGDWEKTQKLAHKIKGGAVYVGTTRIKMACQYLERYWKMGQRNLLERLYQQLLQVFNDSTLEIEK